MATAHSDSSDSDYDDNNQQQHDSDWEDWDAAAGAGGAEGEDEEENDATRSLFDSSVLPSPAAALEYDAATHGFDLRQYRRQACLDDYGTIQVINYIRRQVAAGADPLPALAQAAAAAAAGGASDTSVAAAARLPPWSSEQYLTPVLPDDPLLTYDYEDEGGVDSQQQQQQQGGVASAATTATTSSSNPQQSSSAAGAEVAALKAQLAVARSDNKQLLLRVAALMEVALPADVQRELREAAAEDNGGGGGGGGGGASSLRGDGAGASSSSGSGGKAAVPPASAAAASTSGGVVGVRGRVDAAYYDSYSYFDIHHEMLSDKPRTLAYRSALTSNPSLMQGATVLDVGCGTSILSLFAARGGASAVVGLDGSECIAGFARQIVAANGLDAAAGGGPVTIISGKVEEVADIGHDKVSVIVSEWMGYALLFESMLDSLLAARDKWLRPGGAVLPDRASVWVAGADSGAFGCSFWKDVYGFNMAPVASELASSAASEAKVLVRPVEQACIVTDSKQVHDMDLATMSADQQDFTATFNLTPQAAGGSTGDSSSSSTTSGGVSVSALVLWFDVDFSERFCKECPVTLSTSPSAAPTHWAQAVLPLATPIQLAAAAASDSSSSSTLQCRLSMARSRSKHRCLDISLEVTPVGGGSGAASATTQARVYSMEVTGTD